MKKEFKINTYSNPTKSNPDSYRMKVQYQDRHDGGKIKTTYPRWKNKKEAKQQETQWTRDYERNTGFFAPPQIEQAPEPEKPITVREYCDKYLKHLIKNIQPSSASSREAETKVIADYFDKKLLAEIRRADVEAFYEWLQEQEIDKTAKSLEKKTDKNGDEKSVVEETKVKVKYARSTINHFLKRLRAINRAAILDEVPNVRTINFSKFIKPKMENVRDTIISYDEIEILLENCYGANLRLEIIGLFELGCRLSELKHIRRKHMGNRKVESVGDVLNSKKRLETGVTYRRCYFSNRLRDEILHYHRVSSLSELKPETFIFDTRSLRTAWENLRERVSIKYAEQGDMDTANKILRLQEKDFRTSHKTNLKEARIMQNFSDAQTAHNQDSITSRHYEFSTDEAIAEEFELYETLSEKKRAKIDKAKTAGA